MKKFPVLCLLFSSLLSAETLRQNLGAGDRLEITSPDQAPSVLIQATPRMTARYPDDLLARGVHFRTGGVIEVPMDIRMVDLNSSHVIGAHGEGTVVRYAGRWEADGGNAFPHLALTEGGRFVFTERSSMNLVLAGSFFTRQLWVWGDGTGVLELEEGFVADRTRGEPLADAMGTIRLGGATLITRHTRNLPQNTRPDGRGGHYPNGHIVFERVPSNRWIVDSTNQIYGAQLDFDTDAVVETRTALTHAGHRRVVLPVGPGGDFRSSGAFRTTSADVTITKTGPGMLAMEGEQSYRPGSRLIVEEGLLRMTTDPGLGRDPDAQGNAGVFLRLEIRNQARAHFAGTLHRVRSLVLSDEAELWVDDHLVLEAAEGITAGPGTGMTLAGEIRGTVRSDGRIQLSGHPRITGLEHRGELRATVGAEASEEPLLAGGELSLNGSLSLRFGDRRGRVPEAVLLAQASRLSAGEGFLGPQRCREGRFRFSVVREGGQLWIRDIQNTPE